MSRRWLGIALCCLTWRVAAATPCSVTSRPAGARVRWSRADSPAMHTAGITPCAVDAPNGAGVVLEVTAAGHLPRFVTLAAGQTTAQVDLTRYRPELLPALAENQGVRPARSFPHGARDEERVDPADDGAGTFGLAHELVIGEEQADWRHRLLWRDWQGNERTLRQWAPALGLGWQDNRTLAGWARAATRPGDEDPWQPGPAGSPDGRWVACVVSADKHQPVIVLVRRDGQGQREVARQTGGADLAGPVWSADGAALWYVVHGEAVNTLHRLQLDSGRDQASVTVTSPYVTESPDGATLACWTAAGLTLMDTASGQTRVAAPGWRSGPGRLAWSPDGQTLAGLLGGELALVPRTGGRARLLGRVGRHVTWLPDGSGLLLDQRVIDRGGRVVSSFEPPVDRPWAVSWQPDSRGLLLLGADRWPQAAVLELDGHVRSLPGPGFGAVWDGRPCRDGWLLVVTDQPSLRLQGEARVVHLWPDGRVDALSGPLSSPHGLSVSADGLSLTLLVGMSDRPVPGRLPIPGVVRAPPLAPTAPAESPMIALGSDHDDWQPALASPDGRWLTTIRGDEVIVAEASAPDEPRVLYRAGDRQYGPWIHAARPLEAAR